MSQPHHYLNVNSIKLIFIFSFVGLWGAHALTMRAYTLPELWQEADVIALAKVKSLHFEKRKGKVITIYQFELQTMYQSKFKTHDQQMPLNVILPGGQDGDLEQRVIGIPTLKVGTQYLGFLRCPTIDRCMPVGYGQGLWVAQPNHPVLWGQLIEGVTWHDRLNSTPSQYSFKSLTQKPEITDESQHHSLPNVAQP
jgi:hypothetical protein